MTTVIEQIEKLEVLESTTNHPITKTNDKEGSEDKTDWELQEINVISSIFFNFILLGKKYSKQCN